MHVYRLLCWLLWLALLGNGRIAANQQTYRPHKRRSAFKSVSVSCNAPNKTGPPPDVFWLNLDKSFERRELFEMELARTGLLVGASRIRGLTPDKVVVPEALKVPHDCKTVSEQQYLGWPEFKTRPSGRVFIDGLCGRPRNSKRELAVTVSHLMALRTAVNSGSSSPYALILEDDVEFSFDVDFHALAATAPKGFGVLQLLTSNDGNLKYLWKKYVGSGGRVLWEPRSDVTDFWCAGAYLIDKAVMFPVIERLARKVCAMYHVLCCAVPCCAVLCCAVVCCAVLCCAVLCCAVPCRAVLCCAVLCRAVLCCACVGGRVGEWESGALCLQN